MGRWLRGIALALGATAVTIALSIIVNFLTTDPSPSPAMLLAPERRWQWGAIGLLLLASVGCEGLRARQDAATAAQRQGIAGSTLTHSTAMQAASGHDTIQVFGTAHFPERPELSREDIQNRKTLLGKVKAFWIDKFLNAPNSLYSRARLALDMESQPHRIRPHVEVALPNQAPVPLPQGTRLIDQVDKLPPGGTLLVLGEPGGGKTTLLLELASDLIDRTDPADPAAQIPVVLNLSTWSSFQAEARDGDPFTQWVVNVLFEQYQVGKAQAATWLGQEQLLLLLDGLDEVAEPRRLGCLNAIQQFYQGHGRTPLVVCCRVNDFEALQTTPKFHGTVYIRLLSEAQIEQYLAEAGEPLAGVRAAMAANADLQAQDPDSLRYLAETPLFLNIISMAYRGKTAEEIAALGQQGQRVALFDTYIERMFQQRRDRGAFTQNNTLRWLHILAVTMGKETMFLIERMQPRQWAKKPSLRLQYSLIWGLILGLIWGLILGLILGLIWGLIVGLLWGLIALIEGFKAPIQQTTEPNQGIRSSAKNAVIIGIFSLVLGLALGQGLPPLLGPVLPPEEIQSIVAGSIAMAMFAGLFLGGGRALAQHVALRTVLWLNRLAPRDLAAFLDFAAERLLVQRVGGGYVFVHRLLLEHFADPSFPVRHGLRLP